VGLLQGVDLRHEEPQHVVMRSRYGLALVTMAGTVILAPGGFACSSTENATRPASDASLDVAVLGGEPEAALSDALDAPVGSDGETGTAPADADAFAPIDTGCASPMTWSPIPGSPAGISISGSGPSDVWVVGSAAGSTSYGSTVLRGDGGTWSPVALSSCPDPNPYVYSVWVAARDDVHVAGCMGANGTHTLHHWNGTSWTGFDTGDNRGFGDLWGSSTTDVWASVGPGASGFLERWDGTTWTCEDGAYGIIAGGAAQDFWIYDYSHSATGTSIRHHPPQPPANCSGTMPVSFDRTEAVSTVDPALACDGAPSCVFPIHAGWATATNDVWFVGEGGHALHYDGVSWRVDVTPGGAALRGVWGSSRADVWAVGDRGTIVHYDGSHWAAVTSPASNTLAAVWGSGPCDVWAIGDAIYHGAPAVAVDAGFDAPTDAAAQ
jgi:hypothetical protein